MKVAMCKAYVDQGCCLWRDDQQNSDTGIGFHLRPNMLFYDKTGIVASPVAACPSRTLIKEFDVVLKSRLDLTFPIILDPSLTMLRDQPASHEVIVIRIKLILTPAFILEAFQEQRALQNLGAKCARASGHA